MSFLIKYYLVTDFYWNLTFDTKKVVVVKYSTILAAILRLVNLSRNVAVKGQQGNA